MKTILILSGPQGSGNHMWSKIFALHSKVYGWKKLLDEYWIIHQEEPFAKYWNNPKELLNFDWSISDYYVTSISIPYVFDGQIKIPNLNEFAKEIESLGHKVIFGILGRDNNILNFQQTRVRGNPSKNLALDEYKNIENYEKIYLSYELLHLYKFDYLKNVSNLLNFPIDYKNDKINSILNIDTNKKYCRPVNEHWLDEFVPSFKKRINMSDDKKYREEQLQKVRNLKPVGPAPKINKSKFVPKMAVQRKAGRGR